MREEAAALLDWYDRERRILPWREDPAPYHVWISEIMLQQTRVEAVRGYYSRFLEELPDVYALAEADEERVLKLWEGLGYYSRARNLKKCAEILVEQYGGVFPGTKEALLALPGIGDYTASAIASIAFGEAEPAVDGNLCRIYARRTAFEGDVKDPKNRKTVTDWYRERIDQKRPGDFNQALMDLGATICLPGANPSCTDCPWEAVCEAKARGEVSNYPVRAAKKEKKEEQWTVFLFAGEREKEGGRGKETFCLLKKRPAKGLLAGLYEFPNVPGKLEPADAAAQAADLLAGTGLAFAGLTELGEWDHVFTHRIWRMRGYLVETEKREPAGAGSLFVEAGPADLRERYSVPSAFGFMLDAFEREALRR